ncbi:MAG TPA: hypothetical protein DDZ78_15020, partial [Porphyromonadaceae bacterium]|nr:hypothetical protein [Porphyromonadaceae bacterium]
MKIRYGVIIGLLLISALHGVQAKIYPVANLEEFNKTVPTLGPGDEIVLKNGVWRDVEFQFFGK